MLYVLRAATPERLELSDRICTALQLVEHWQDVGEDFRRDRVYLPFEDLQQYSVTEDDLAQPTTLTNVKTLVYFETFRTRQLLDDGAPLVHTLSGWGRLAVAGYVGGGYATLDAIERAECEVLPVGPKATRLEQLKAAFRVLRERPGRRMTVAAGYERCREITRASAGNFYYGIRLLAARPAACALLRLRVRAAGRRRRGRSAAGGREARGARAAADRARHAPCHRPTRSCWRSATSRRATRSRSTRSAT